LKSSIKLSLIAARSRNGAIGKDGNLPWRLAEDLAFFKSATLGHPIIMGRKTWESLPRRPLPGRENIILSRDWSYQAKGARVYTAMRPAIEAGKALARAESKREVFVVGGEAIYAATLPHADMIYITEVDTVIEGDAFFPQFDESKFEEVTSRSVAADEHNEHAFQLRVLKRKK
jgi:dihydrofolate reductase